MGVWPSADLSAFSAASGLTAFTGAFVVTDRNKSCSPTWAGYTAYAIGGAGDFKSTVSAFQATGGRFTVSFGGVANTELARSCTDVASLQKAYASVVDRFAVDRIDFDIEGADVSDSASNKRRAAAIAALQTQYAAAGKTLQVTVTLPVMPTGLVSTGLRTVTEFAAAGVKLSAVNIMAMDYGLGTKDMGAAAIAAAKSTAAQLASVPAYAGLTAAQRLSLVGLTPMIGANDTAGETFTLADAAAVGAFAKASGLAQVAWWEMTRDQPCTAGIPTYMCSGVADAKWSFAKAFIAATN